MTIKLMIKTHAKTGLKYLCKTKQEGRKFETYLGSGTEWLKHLAEHGKTVTTEVIFETEDKEEFKRVALAKSLEFDIVKSNEWANLKVEVGDGGPSGHPGGWKLSPERRKQISENNRTRIVSEETKQRMKIAHTGKSRKGVNKGRTFTEEQKRRFSAAQIKRWENYRRSSAKGNTPLS